MIVDTSQLIGHPNKTTWMLWKIGTEVRIQAMRRTRDLVLTMIIAVAARLAPRNTPLIA